MLIAPEEFENHSITSKVWRQLQVVNPLVSDDPTKLRTH